MALDREALLAQVQAAKERLKPSERCLSCGNQALEASIYCVRCIGEQDAMRRATFLREHGIQDTETTEEN